MKTKNKEKFNQLPQREKKYAKTKIALLNALMNELEKKSLSSIKIKELADLADVSEPTFFNYFDSKAHILVYYIQMWSIDMNTLAVKSEVKHSSYIETIKDIFRVTSKQIAQQPQIMLEIISFQSQGLILNPHTISAAEKWIFFPEVDDIEVIEGLGLESILPPLISKALEAKEIPQETDKELLFLTLSSLFFGTALLILKRSPESYERYLEAQMTLIFKGLTC